MPLHLLRSGRSILIAGIALSASVVIALATIGSPAAARAADLPMRETPIPYTTSGVPHVQVGVEPVPEISAEILERVQRISTIEVQNSIVSLPGALGFSVKEDVPLARPEVIVRGREFAHIHPDGSLHASLPPGRAIEATNAGWAVPHPWSNERPGWEGFVLIFTPTNSDEMGVVFQLIVESYEFVTGLEAM